ncbi:MAG: DUF3866 family protein [Chthonomonadales bacterium]
MRSRATGIVERIEDERPGIQEIAVRVDGELRHAINYPSFTGTLHPGDVVLLNTWAVSLGLGTGGYDFVMARTGCATDEEPPGHIMKMRYTPVQTPVLAAEAPESPYHEMLASFHSLEGTPVVCAELHSQVAPVAAAAKLEAGSSTRVVYVMTDGAALPIALSRTVDQMRRDGLVEATVTAGQAFGGDYEAVNLYSALAVAKAAAHADVIIVSQGPGGVGTATPLGFTGIDQGIALNAAVSLGGTPIAVVRLSFTDPRPRHHGISHHTLTVLERVALSSVMVPVPRLRATQNWKWRAALANTDLLERHQFVTVDAELGIETLAKGNITFSTMGRSLKEERPFFLSAVAAGLLAGQWISGQVSSPRITEGSDE